jgi:transcriptional regulator with XRE-family HTH domain
VVGRKYSTQKGKRMNHGKLIKQYRTEMGWSQTKLASLCDVKQQNIAKYETGARAAKVETLKRIFDALGYDLVIEVVKR